MDPEKNNDQVKCMNSGKLWKTPKLNTRSFSRFCGFWVVGVRAPWTEDMSDAVRVGDAHRARRKVLACRRWRPLQESKNQGVQYRLSKPATNQEQKAYFWHTESTLNDSKKPEHAVGKGQIATRTELTGCWVIPERSSYQKSPNTLISKAIEAHSI